MAGFLRLGSGQYILDEHYCSDWSLYKKTGLYLLRRIIKVKIRTVKRNRAEFDRETNCLDRILKHVTR